MNTNQRSACRKFPAAIMTAVLIILMCALSEAQTQQNTSSPSAGPAIITLQDALARAQKNEPQYRNALTQYGVARANTVQGRAALLPNVSYAGSVIYSQATGTDAPRFIANNGVHEYITEAMAHEALSWQPLPIDLQARAPAR